MIELDGHFLKQTAKKVKDLRLAANLSQEGLANRAGIALPTYRRFETTGEISLRRFYRICSVLGRSSDMERILEPSPVRSLKELHEPKKRHRGRRS